MFLIDPNDISNLRMQIFYIISIPLLTKSQEYMKFMSCGHPDYAITDEQLIEKFRRNCEFTLTPEQQDAAIEALLDLENIEDVADLMAKLVP